MNKLSYPAFCFQFVVSFNSTLFIKQAVALYLSLKTIKKLKVYNSLGKTLMIPLGYPEPRIKITI